MTKNTFAKVEALLKEFGYAPVVDLSGYGDLYAWRVFRVRTSESASWQAWSTEGDIRRTGQTLASLKNYLHLMHA